MVKVLFDKPDNKNKEVSCVLNYHPLFKKVNFFIRKHLHLLYMNEEVQCIWNKFVNQHKDQQQQIRYIKWL